MRSTAPRRIDRQAVGAGCKRDRTQRNCFSRGCYISWLLVLVVDCAVEMRVLVSGLQAVRTSPTRSPWKRALWQTTTPRPALIKINKLQRQPLSCRMTTETTQNAYTLKNAPAAAATTLPSCCGRLFDLEVPEGRCVGLQLEDLADTDPNSVTADQVADENHWLHQLLHPAEVAYGLELKQVNRASFWIGRLALRQALEPESVTDPILKDSHGRPVVPAGFLGSISHKRRAGVALVVALDGSDASSGPPRLGVGVDIEKTSSSRKSVARYVLTLAEQEELGQLEGISKQQEVLLRFSIKESLYKAMHPLINQYVGFQEAQVQPLADGSVKVKLNLKSGADERFGDVTAHWQRVPGQDFFLTSASVRLKDEE